MLLLGLFVHSRTAWSIALCMVEIERDVAIRDDIMIGVRNAYASETHVTTSTVHRALVYPFPGLNPALSVPQSLKSPCSASQRLDPLVTLSSLLDNPSVTCSVGPRPTLIPLWLCLRASTNERAQHRDSVQNPSLTITMSTSYSILSPHHRSSMIDRRPLHPAASPGVLPVHRIRYSGHVVHSFRSA